MDLASSQKLTRCRSIEAQTAVACSAVDLILINRLAPLQESKMFATFPRFALIGRVALALSPSVEAFVPPKHHVARPNFTGAAASKGNAEDDEFGAKHDFELQRQYYTVWGIKGTMPGEQYQMRQRLPVAVCRNCRKRIDTKLVQGEEEEGIFVLKLPEWKKQYMVPTNVSVLEEKCGDVVRFRIQGTTVSIQREILEKHHPDCVLTKQFLEVWGKDPYANVPFDADSDYFRHVLDYVRDGSIVLPAQVLKTAFLQDLKSYNISFVETDITPEIDPRVIGEAIGQIDDQLRAFKRRTIEKDLQRDFDKAKKRLEGAKLAHFILETYFRTHSLRMTIKKENIPKDILKILETSVFGNLSDCNPFLEEFGLQASSVENLYNYGEFCILIDLKVL
jgi:BTB/POZ domain